MEKLREKVIKIRAGAKAIVTHWSFYPFGLVALIEFFLFTDQNVVAPNLTQISVEFGLTPEERDLQLGGFMNLASNLVAAFVVLIAGYLTDVMDRRNLFALLVFGGEFSMLFVYLATNVGQLTVIRCFVAIAMSGVRPIIFSFVGDYFYENRGKVLSLMMMLQMAGILMGQTLASTLGPLPEQGGYGWRVPFLVCAIPTLILAPLFILTTKDPKKGGLDKNRIKHQQQEQVIVVSDLGTSLVGGEATQRPADKEAQPPVEEEKEVIDFKKLPLLFKNKSVILVALARFPSVFTRLVGSRC
jgi:MFS family permease